eukprot:jgi/Botrbrau1/6805/Bobra.0153s0008.1
MVSQVSMPPAVLPETPDVFPIPPERLIQLAQKVFFDEEGGLRNPDVLADNFRFEFPIVSLNKKEYLKAVGSFQLKVAFPDLDAHPYDWRVDKYEPNRVWFTTRTSCTHTGDLKFGIRVFKATNKVVLSAPECLSYVFNEEGKVTSFTGGYIMDRRVGNTNNLGAMFGILSAIGVYIPPPGSIIFTSMVLFMKLLNFLMKFFSGSKEE